MDIIGIDLHKRESELRTLASDAASQSSGHERLVVFLLEDIDANWLTGQRASLDRLSASVCVRKHHEWLVCPSFSSELESSGS